MRRYAGTLAWPERLLWIGLLLLVISFRWATAQSGWTTTAAGAKDAIHWRSDLDSALRESRQSGRPVLVDFSASWCPPCIAMKHEVWPNAAVGQAVEAAYVPVQIDVDQNGAISDRFRVDSIPTVLILDGNGREIRRSGFLPTSGMLRFLAGS